MSGERFKEAVREGCFFFFLNGMGFRGAITAFMWYNGSMKLETTELKESIADAVNDFANKKRKAGVKSLS